MIKQLLAGLGIALLLCIIGVPVSGASPATDTNGSIQDVIDRSGVDDRGSGTSTGPITPKENGDASKPVMTFPSGSVSISGASGVTGQAGQTDGANATLTANGTARQSAGAFIPLTLGALAVLLVLRRRG